MNIELKLIENTEGISQETLEKTKSEFGMIPNMYAGMGNNGALLDSYKHSYDSFRKNAGFNPLEQEVIFLAISYANECSYCIAAHSTVADVNNFNTEVIQSLRTGVELQDSKLESLRNFASIVTETRGRLSEDQVQSFLDAGYTKNHIMGVITAVGVKVFSNYFNHLFTVDLDEVFCHRVWISDKSASDEEYI